MEKDLQSIVLADAENLAINNSNICYLLCVLDVYSRYGFVHLLKNKSIKNAKKKFEDIILK